ncbi:rhomboid family intramembrane serine protease [Salegentibacter mishustinae]|jgi:membrane associated rhomboid family serine protease|uniref:Protease n=1 Tax=Salegentibacter mishustinae TaxID=270918 RepID=A0A0Q9ZHT1_9FLAO|nr:rhomboid family intramembrane serine protease [Salegentibacter mishustinae]KRG29242.1 protease [Salegentibacter mishustinae]MDX1720301.1 rhomboid family intramembrane serine protease [Salegentibacter mishustinae]PNW21709.1 protease [Salegentibacter mishustinae]PZX65049.1 membrane associated rhomboid family serine protease [Salegentibacter mishustinae]UBZ08863.1 rhomboid family intramembrane serine protease [Salegentibacter mishustinae]|tara:strand:+ start:311 stop:1225 length:915 start_codon:yes stop_codon:yes gene_type:complete
MKGSDKIRYKLQTATVVEKLIAINVLVFFLFFLFRTIAYLFQLPSDFLLEWFVFPKEPGEFIFKPWSIITYSFLHGGIWHILSNMLILYFSGIYFLNYFSPKRLLNYFFLGVIMGALVYMLSYNLFPAFQSMGRSYLIGASAGVMAVLVGIATYIPNMRVKLLLIGSIKFWYIAAFLVALDIIQIPMSNAGGHLAHLGGAALGYVYTKQLQKGNDIGSWFEKIMDSFASLFKTTERKAKMKTVYRKNTNKKSATEQRKPFSSRKLDKDEKQKQIDAILDKISKSGYDSLSKSEKDFLFKAGKED